MLPDIMLTDILVFILVQAAFFGVIGVVVWRTVIAIRRNAQKARGGARAGDLDRLGDAIAELRQDLDRVRADIDQQGGQLAETVERLDFTERLLTQMRERSALPPRSKP